MSDVSVQMMKDGKVGTEKVKIVPLTAELLIVQEMTKRQETTIPNADQV